ncbi:MAG: Butyrate-acetoacetate CoA-transferase subunit B [Bacillota bacterium]|nr:MAG: Butyrate-acetoacetate CoA-transferase subunit B [Bacillota bacterium]MBS3949824.1 CoA transferase subunit B [Peptococcaceae bacterium]
MSKDIKRERIARRIASELQDGMVVNLGIGLPTQVANFLPRGNDVLFQSENGFVGLGPAPLLGHEDPNVTNAGSQPVTILPGGACFDSAMSFVIIRGGHVDVTVLGALEVDEAGNLANWMVPGKIVPGMGGAMDLTVGARRVIVAMEHTAKGNAKILKKCTLPLTAIQQVDMIVTEMAVIEVTRQGLVLKEIAPDTTVMEVVAQTEATLIINDVKVMEV